MGSGNGSLLRIFSDVKGKLTQFIVVQKVNRVKEMLLYEDLTLSEISEKLKYQSIDLMVAQYKNHTGLNPGYFIKLKKERELVAKKSELFFDGFAKFSL